MLCDSGDTERAGLLGRGAMPESVAIGTVECAVTQLRQMVAGAALESTALLIDVDAAASPVTPQMWAACIEVLANRIKTQASVIQPWVRRPLRVLVVWNVTCIQLDAATRLWYTTGRVFISLNPR